jgi:hypothetical protein
VTGVLEGKSSFKKGEVVTFRTQQFDVAKARFFQTYLNGSKKSYTQNGIYDAQKNTLQITLPPSIETGKYELSFMLSNPELGTKYNFQTDILISISE